MLKIRFKRKILEKNKTVLKVRGIRVVYRVGIKIRSEQYAVCIQTELYSAATFVNKTCYYEIMIHEQETIFLVQYLLVFQISLTLMCCALRCGSIGNKPFNLIN